VLKRLCIKRKSLFLLHGACCVRSLTSCRTRRCSRCRGRLGPAPRSQAPANSHPFKQQKKLSLLAATQASKQPLTTSSLNSAPAPYHFLGSVRPLCPLPFPQSQGPRWDTPTHYQFAPYHFSRLRVLGDVGCKLHPPPDTSAAPTSYHFPSLRVLGGVTPPTRFPPIPNPAPLTSVRPLCPLPSLLSQGPW